MLGFEGPCGIIIPKHGTILDHLMFTVMDELRYTCKYRVYLRPSMLVDTLAHHDVYVCIYLHIPILEPRAATCARIQAIYFISSNFNT